MPHFAQSGVDPALVAGTQVNAQLFVREPGAPQPNDYALGEGVEFVLQPRTSRGVVRVPAQRGRRAR